MDKLSKAFLVGIAAHIAQGVAEDAIQKELKDAGIPDGTVAVVSAVLFAIFR